MKVLRTAVVTTMLTAGLIGCVGSPRPSGEAPVVVADPPPCPPEIQVDYLPGGMPVVGTPACWVLQNQFVTWSGPPGSTVRFKIEPKPSLVVWDYDERGDGTSMAIGPSEKVRKKMIGPPGTYQYAVKANSKVLDPAIIIRAP